MTTAAVDVIPSERQGTPPVVLPRKWPWMFNGFRKYARRYVRKHFHAVRLSNSSAPLPTPDAPTLVVLNHPGWWDPLVCVLLTHRFGEARDHYAAIDAVAVEKYRFFTRLGFFGVDTHTFRGAAGFLRTGGAVLSRPDRVLWVTAQGRFSDVRTRPLALRSGVGHLAARLVAGYVVPLAIEYSFWNERTPEALARFGTPLVIGDARGRSGRAWTAAIEAALTDTLDCLNREAMTRDPTRFTTLAAGRTGVGGVYDGWRRVKAWATGSRFEPAHEPTGANP